jgi:SAM-dependent methyltransferase
MSGQKDGGPIGPTWRHAKRFLKRSLGEAVAWLRPDIVRKIESGVGTSRLPAWGASLADRLVTEALIARHTAAGSEERLAEAHRVFWTGEPAMAIHEEAQRRFEHSFLGEHFPFVEALERVLGEGRYHTLCEIGCGAGLAIDHFARRLPALKRLIGLDLCRKQVALNRQRYGDPRLEFVADDATSWIPAHAAPGTAFLTYNGVLEYFTQPALEALFAAIAAQAPACIALVEPIAPDYDLEHEVRSRLFGGELSLSHNYPRALAAAGFHVRWQRELPRGRYLMMIACKEGDQG